MSKSIEALNRIETVVPFNRENKPNYYSQFMQSETPFYEDFDLVKKDLEVLEKLEKALEIIKNKCAANTNIWLVVCTRTYEDYESFVENKDHKLVRLEHNILTQQEYELLKEALE